MRFGRNMGLPAAIGAALGTVLLTMVVAIPTGLAEGALRWGLGLDRAVSGGLRCLGGEAWVRLTGPTADPARFSILIAQLARDEDGGSSRVVRDAFRGARGFEPRTTCLAISADEGHAMDRGENAGEAAARTLAINRRADLVLWGEVADPEHRRIRVWFTAPGMETRFDRNGWLIERGLLAEAFQTEFATMLQTVAIAAVEPALAVGRAPQVQAMLTPLVPRLRRLVDQPPAALSPLALAEMTLALADALVLQGGGGRDAAAVDEATTRYRRLLAQEPEAQGLRAGMLQHRLGVALLSHPDAAARLPEAINTLGAALAAYRGGRAPLQWWLVLERMLGASAAWPKRQAILELDSAKLRVLDAELAHLDAHRDRERWRRLAVERTALAASLAAFGDMTAIDASIAAMRRWLADEDAADPARRAVPRGWLAISLGSRANLGDEAAMQEAIAIFDALQPGTIFLRAAHSIFSVPLSRDAIVRAMAIRGDRSAHERHVAMWRDHLRRASADNAWATSFAQTNLSDALANSILWGGLADLREAAALARAAVAEAAASPALSPQLIEAALWQCNAMIWLATMGAPDAPAMTLPECDSGRRAMVAAGARAGDQAVFDGLLDAAQRLATSPSGTDPRLDALLRPPPPGDAPNPWLLRNPQTVALLATLHLRTTQGAAAPTLVQTVTLLQEQRGAMLETNRNRDPISWAVLQSALGAALAYAATPDEPEAAQAALTAFADAEAALPPGRRNLEVARIGLLHAEALARLAPLRGGQGLDLADRKLTEAEAILAEFDVPGPRGQAMALRAQLEALPRQAEATPPAP
jgi:hypothetical protein